MAASPTILADLAPKPSPLRDESSLVRQGLQGASKGTNHQTPAAPKPGPDATRKPFEARKIRVACIGAGCSGLFLAICQEQQLENCEFVIYEKNTAVSGTWYENVYPGAACDVPAPIYTYTFAPNPDWSTYYAGSDEIRTYFEGVFKDFQIAKYVKFNHRVVSAIWDDAAGKWNMEVATGDGKIIEDKVDVLLNCGGVLNAWKWPKIKGLETFQGKLLHTAKFDRSYDYAGKNVALIGCGSSGVQTLPGLQKTASRVDTYFRSRFWVSDPLLGRVAAHFKWTERNPQYTFNEEEKKRFRMRAVLREDPTYYLQIRREIEHDMNQFLYDHRFSLAQYSPLAHRVSRWARGLDMCSPNTPSQNYIREQATNKMKTALKDRPDILDKIFPKDFDIGCRRLTPGPGFLEALAADNVDYISDEIAEVTKDSIITSDGKERKVDAIVCATGFDNSWAPRFHLEGKDGYICGAEFAKNPRSHLSMSLANLPNYFIMFGPNCCGANGSAIPVIEECGEYMVKFIKKMQTQDIKSFVVKPEAIEDFVAQKDEIMKGTVFVQPCSSWYKQGTVDGPVTGTWPGSTLHFLDVIREPRWEDFDWEYTHTTRFSYLGNGLSKTETTGQHRSQHLVDRINRFDDIKKKYGVPILEITHTELLEM